MTREQYGPGYRYGQWAGNEKGNEFRDGYCKQEVWPRDGWVSYQCRNRAKDGCDGYCGLHHKAKP